MENKGLVSREQDGFGELVRMGDQLVKTGFLPACIKTGVQAAAIIQTGRELGLPAMTALNQIAVIQGRPTLSAQLMLALMIRAGIKVEWIKQTPEVAVIQLIRPGWNAAAFQFTIEEAKIAGLMKSAAWEKYPAAMLRARAIGIAARAYAPDVLGGISYTPEELGTAVTMDHQGDIVVSHEALVLPAAVPLIPHQETSPGPAAGEDPLSSQLGAPSLADELAEYADQLGPRDQIIRTYSLETRNGKGYAFGEADILRVVTERPNWARSTLSRIRAAIDNNLSD